MRRFLPTIASLRAFEAVARRRSFTLAAVELNLTQTGVSHQVRKLETLLGVQLFIRDQGGTQLTDAGNEYLETVRSSLLLLAGGTQRILERAKEDTISVACLSAFGLKCLIPRLSKFRDLYPNVKVRLDLVGSFDAAATYNYDVSIRYGDGLWPGLSARKLHGEKLFPVCSPSLLAECPLNGLDDLRNHTAIRTTSLGFSDDWADLLAAAGVRELDFADEITCNAMLTAVQAAIDGFGVVMGRTPLITGYLRSKQLARPFKIALESASGYYVTSAAERAQQPYVQLFSDWLLGTLADTKVSVARPPEAFHGGAA
jgi:LysR family glycine cleavage system transcriptional activator